MIVVVCCVVGWNNWLLLFVYILSFGIVGWWDNDCDVVDCFVWWCCVVI